MLRVFIIFLLAFINSQTSCAQLVVNDSDLLKNCPIIRLDKSHLIGDSIALQGLRNKMSMYNATPHPTLNVIHIGDSHVQAGSFSESLQNLFCTQYGNGGIGLIFPYRVAKTNGPSGYVSSSNHSWVARRNVIVKLNLPTGISGHTIHSKDPSASFSISLKQDSVITISSIKTLTIFHADRDTNYSYLVTGDDSVKASIDSSSLTNHSSSFIFPKNVFSITIKSNATAPTQKSSTITGLYVTNGNANAAITSVIGVNGARYSDYLHSEWFDEQLSSLNPQLIIVSLGTNESFEYTKLDVNIFAQQIDSLVTLLKGMPSKPIVILTTPPAVCMAKRRSKHIVYVPNPYVAKVRQTILQQAAKNHLLVFDLYEAMGGEHSMKWWAEHRMTDKRRIHFTNQGYRILGLLLARSIAEQIAPSL